MSHFSQVVYVALDIVTEGGQFLLTWRRNTHIPALMMKTTTVLTVTTVIVAQVTESESWMSRVYSYPLRNY